MLDREIETKVAIIGTGRVGERHARALHELGATLSLYDTDPVKSYNLAQSLRQRVTVSKSLDLAINGTDLVYISTPFVNHLHMEPIRLAVEQGMAIFCEKPITDNLEDAYKIKDMVNQSGVPFVVGNYHLFNRPIEELLRKYNAGKIGQAKELNLSYMHDMTALFAGSWRNKDNYLYDAGIHPVDLALLLAGEKNPISTVSCRIKSDDYYLELGFKSGMPARIRVSYRPQEPTHEANYGVGLQIVGTEGMLEATSLGSTLTITKDRGTQVLEIPQGLVPLPVNRIAGTMLDLVSGKVSNYYPLPGIDRSLKSIQVLVAAEKSIKRGGAHLLL